MERPAWLASACGGKRGAGGGGPQDPRGKGCGRGVGWLPRCSWVFGGSLATGVGGTVVGGSLVAATPH